MRSPGRGSPPDAVPDSGPAREAEVRAAVKRHLLALLADDPEVAAAVVRAVSGRHAEIAREVAEALRREFLRKGDVRAEALRYPPRG